MVSFPSKKDEEETQEVTACLTAAKEISLDAAVEAVLTETDGNFTLKHGMEGFSQGGKDVSHRGVPNVAPPHQ